MLFFLCLDGHQVNMPRERSGSLVECLTRDRRALCPSARTLILVLLQPKKTRPYRTERLLMGRKESNQTNK